MWFHRNFACIQDVRRNMSTWFATQMMPAVAKRNLARFVDVFCERGAFSAEETAQIFGLRENSNSPFARMWGSSAKRASNRFCASIQRRSTTWIT